MNAFLFSTLDRVDWDIALSMFDFSQPSVVLSCMLDFILIVCNTL